MNNAGGLHWPELGGPIGIVLIVVQDWFTILVYPIQKLQMNIEFWYMPALIVPMTSIDQKCFQLEEIR